MEYPGEQSERQFTDALRIFEVRYGDLDLDYLNKWVVTLGIEEMWKGLQDEAETYRKAIV